MLFEVTGLTKRFDGLTAVADLSFGIDQGEIIGVFGPNGSGKTTLLSLIAGMLAPTTGTIVWKGNEIQRAIGGAASPKVIAPGGTSRRT